MDSNNENPSQYHRYAGPARNCSCDVYAVCSVECQSSKLGYCGIWDPITGEELWSKAQDNIVCCAFSSIANRMAVLCYKVSVDVSIVVWDLLSGDDTLSVTGNIEYDRFCEFNQDGNKLVSWNYRPEGICVRDILSGTVLFTLLGQGGWPCFVGDAVGNSVAVRRGASIHVLDIDSGNEVSCFHTDVGEQSIRRPLASSDGRLCSVYSLAKLGVWEVSTGRALFGQIGVDIASVCFGGNVDLIVVSWVRATLEERTVVRGVPDQRTLTCWRITDGTVMFEVSTLCDRHCYSSYSSLRSSFFFGNSHSSLYEIDASTGATLARATISNLSDLRCIAATTILL
jgi:hypothetical protein